MLRIGSLFSGYGGLDHAAGDVLGGRPVWFAENDAAASTVLAHRWPGVPNHGDLATINWATVPGVDVLTGGFPCQDVSDGGKRAGLIRRGNTSTRSGLWAAMATAIDHLKPRLVIAENVRGLLHARADSDVEPCPWCVDHIDPKHRLRALGAVLGDLADLGYDTAWHGLRASDIGACHHRFRIFLAAWPATDPSCLTWRLRHRDHGSPHHHTGVVAAHAEGDRRHQGSRDLHPGRACTRGQWPGHPPGNDPHHVQWGAYGPAIRRWAHTLGRIAPAPTESGPTGSRRLSPRFVEWMQGLDDGHVTDVPGLTRTGMLTMLGNGVIPQQAAAAIPALLAMGRDTREATA